MDKIIIFLISVIIPLSDSADLNQSSNCNSSAVDYNCGSIRGIRHPFWGGDRPASCGLQEFKLVCMNNQYSLIDMDPMRFRVLEINQSASIMRIARDDLWNGTCPVNYWPTSLNYSHFTYAYHYPERQYDYEYLRIFYGCSSEANRSHILVQSNSTCSINSYTLSAVFFAHYSESVRACNISLDVVVHLTAFNELWDGTLTLQEALNQGFYVQYYETPPVYPYGTNNLRKKPLIGIGAALIGILSICFIIYRIRKSSSNPSMAFWKRKTNDDKNVEAFIKQYVCLTTKRYRYSDVVKITNSFKVELGQGGYGSVYKGRLPDSCVVAVKVLNASKENGEEFINEVVSIGALLGFCYKSKKRALIYEFMPNGSLEKFIYLESPLKTDQHLGVLQPSMNKVIEMLEGNIEALQIPRMPFLSSPPRSPADSSTSLASDL